MVSLILDALLVALLAKMDIPLTQIKFADTAEMVKSVIVSSVIQMETITAFLVPPVEEVHLFKMENAQVIVETIKSRVQRFVKPHL